MAKRFFVTLLVVVRILTRILERCTRDTHWITNTLLGIGHEFREPIKNDIPTYEKNLWTGWDMDSDIPIVQMSMTPWRNDQGVFLPSLLNFVENWNALGIVLLFNCGVGWTTFLHIICLNFVFFLDSLVVVFSSLSKDSPFEPYKNTKKIFIK